MFYWRSREDPGEQPTLMRQFQGVLRDCGAHLTANYAVDELCSSFPARLRELVAAKGGRLNH